MTPKIPEKKLGVNIDHVATVRQARRAPEPSVLEAALEAERGGADSITIHLREDRRHIQGSDLFELLRNIHVPLNLEMSVSPEILKIALKGVPEKACLVPEKRQEITTEGGLDLFNKRGRLERTVNALQKRKIEVSLFIDPDEKQVREAARLGVEAIEIHTGAYANASGKARNQELERIKRMARLGSELGLRIHAGHGLTYGNIFPLLRIPGIREFNIGHSIVSRAFFVGIAKAVAEMKKIITSGK
ncbi:MAG TPA: pyridoxine 5'-phosphate synthase [Candidatus Omnitrophota bacterium]|jgi:pyridoxine 5-phosphate synthase|nr:MAG: Pyridoxine 5'-phosphate synthase [Candidatus Omnitrophica bacterium ADurb.Bin314]HQB93769.1 pyridoxine 5'-phosphate synthase [Candidatus Omnitrophota bacterium]